MRGFAAIGLHRPKSHINVGSVMRAAFCYNASLVCLAGERGARSLRKMLNNPTDTPRAFQHIPTITGDSLRDMIPAHACPVAVDLVDDATPLPAFQHPPRAFYIFGPEDGTLGKDVLDWCPKRIMVPTRMCMNLAATVNVVLYDRLAKADRQSRGISNAATFSGGQAA